MRSLTQPALWRVINSYGPPSAYFTEFVRVHSDFVINESFVEECLMSADKTPVWIQLMGNDVSAIIRNVDFLQKFPIKGVDFNVGCPMPKIFKKNAGGGLLRDLNKLKQILTAIREHSSIPMCVKTRIGFENSSNFNDILDVITSVKPDLLVIHARTVKQMYSGEPNYNYIKIATNSSQIPVVANGNINTCNIAETVVKTTNCSGIMIGRAAISNPWIFMQWESYINNKQIYTPNYNDYLNFLLKIYHEFNLSQKHEKSALGILKNFVSYLISHPANNININNKILQSSSLKEFWQYL